MQRCWRHGSAIPAIGARLGETGENCMFIFRFQVALLMVLCPALKQQVQSSQLPSSDRAQRQTHFWGQLKGPLTAPNGPEYFRLSLKDAEVPGGIYGLWWIRGTVVSSEPSAKPREIILAISNRTDPEVKLLLKKSLPNALPTGTEIDFSGIARTFTASPFILTFEVIRIEKRARMP
jgi:hypothetical protein